MVLGRIRRFVGRDCRDGENGIGFGALEVSRWSDQRDEDTNCGR